MSADKKVAMAINYDYPDYGGMLQAYASYRVIKQLGHSPEVLNVENLSRDIKRRKLCYFAKNIFDLSILKEKSKVLSKKVRSKINVKLKNEMNLRNTAFSNFSESHFEKTCAFASWDSLSEGCREYSSVVVGSDQLWLPSNIAGDYYTLSFVPDDVKKIAYATSFGVSIIAHGQENKAKVFLSRIDFLSAREESGKQIIKTYTGRDVPLVCDPAMLLSAEEWDQDATPGRLIEGNYIFCYFMGDNPWQRSFVKEISGITGYKIVSLLHLDQYIKSDEAFADEAPFDISPSDFLNLVRNADIVCTDSFHGTVFSMLYGKKFFTFKRFSEKATLSTNTRIDTLLKITGMEDRLITEKADASKELAKEIDTCGLKMKLSELRSKSMDYLVSALEA